MKRLRRLILNALTLLSLFLCLATAVFWVRSYSHDEGVSWVLRSGLFHAQAASEESPFLYHSIGAGSADGRLCWIRTVARIEGYPHDAIEKLLRDPKETVGWYVVPLFFENAQQTVSPSTPVFQSDRWYDEGAFTNEAYHLAPRTPRMPWVSYDIRRTLFPHWSLVLAASLLPFTRLFLHLRRRRITLIGHCTKCGYDLRATPNRCPECGTIPEGATP